MNLESDYCEGCPNLRRLVPMIWLCNYYGCPLVVTANGIVRCRKCIYWGKVF